jgi:hypothetical protein
MGKINNGINGPFIGQVGPVVGYMWHGINCIRTKPQHIRDRKSKRQVAQRQCLSEVLRFMQSMTGYLRIGFGSMPYVYHQSAFNAAMSHNMRNGVKGKNSDLKIDYVHAAVAQGDLLNATNVKAEIGIGKITINWDYSREDISVKASDYAMPLIYNRDKRQTIYDTESVRRNEGELTMELPESWAGDRLEVYLSFQSQDGKHVANSIHVGHFKAVKLRAKKIEDGDFDSLVSQNSGNYTLEEDIVRIRGINT